MRRLVLAAFLLLGCRDVTAPSGAEPFTPPLEYRVWWGELEACSLLSGNFDEVVFYLTPPVPFGEPRGRGTITPPRIYLASDSYMIELLVKHEMMHVLGKLQDHDARYFMAYCGDLMSIPGPQRPGT